MDFLQERERGKCFSAMFVPRQLKRLAWHLNFKTKLVDFSLLAGNEGVSRTKHLFSLLFVFPLHLHNLSSRFKDEDIFPFTSTSSHAILHDVGSRLCLLLERWEREEKKLKLMIYGQRSNKFSRRIKNHQSSIHSRNSFNLRDKVSRALIRKFSHFKAIRWVMTKWKSFVCGPRQ